MIRKLCFSLLAAVIGGLCNSQAQTIAAYKEHLERQIVSESAPEGANVVVNEHGNVAAVASAADAHKGSIRLNGYRVCIFFDNSPNARSEAVAARTLFQEHFADIPIYMEYENPYFRVTVGNCATIEEAIILKGLVAPYFPKAFPKSQEMTLNDLIK